MFLWHMNSSELFNAKFIFHTCTQNCVQISSGVWLGGGARGVMVIVVGNGHGDTSSNPGRDNITFHIALIPLGKLWIQLFSPQLWVK